MSRCGGSDCEVLMKKRSELNADCIIVTCHKSNQRLINSDYIYPKIHTRTLPTSENGFASAEKRYQKIVGAMMFKLLLQ